jgi:hypothetical protein
MNVVTLRRALVVGGLVVIAASASALSFGGHRIITEQSAYRLPAAGQCVPTQLNRSDIVPGTNVAAAPLPGSLDASPQTQISLLGVPISRLRNVSATGSETGDHSGRLRAYSQGDGASFVPDKPFRSGEVVTVRGTEVDGDVWKRFSYRFAIAYESPVAHAAGNPNPSPKPGDDQSFHSASSLRPPSISVGTQSSEASHGDIFMAPYAGPSQDGPMILSETGKLIWFDALPFETEATNLQVQHYEGKPVLTWWQGYIPPQGFGEGEELVDNTAYQRVLTVHAGNGYKADLHDFHLLPDHRALLTVFNPIRCDLNSVGGPQGAAVTDSGFQEIDLRTGLVRRQWFPLDHVAMGESYAEATHSSTAWPFDYFHLNSIDVRPQNKALLSSRNTSALYEINWRTGRILTQIGGKSSTVKMGPGTSTAYQHDASVLDDGDIAVFDNGGVPQVHPESRALVEKVDKYSRTATMVTQYLHPAALSAASQGSVQALPNGNYFVGWGAQPYVSEFSPSGKLLFDAHAPERTESYRSYRFEWHATPAAPPAISVSDPASDSSLTVYASWNGATEVASWQLLGGESPEDLTPLGTTPSAGFETSLQTPGPEAYVEVEALDAAGTVIGTSAAVKS